MISFGRVSILSIAAGSAALFGQSLSIGVKGGARASDDFQATSKSGRYVVGPTLELTLPLRFSIVRCKVICELINAICEYSAQHSFETSINMGRRTRR